MIHNNLNFIIEKVGTKTILYLHGWGGNNSSLDKIKTVPNSTIISLDFFYSKDSVAETYDTYQSALDLYLTLKDNGIDSLSIVAHSYGGRVAIILSSMFDIKVENLILIASAGINLFSIKSKIRLLNFKLVKLLVKIGVYSNDILSKYGSADYKVLSPKFKQIFSNIVRQDLRHLLPKISAKSCTLIYGDTDDITSTRIMKILCRYIPCAVCYIIPDAGHFLYLTHTSEVLDIINSVI